jgi:hypothetical protein
MPTLDYREHLFEDLMDSEYAAEYLTAALDEGEDARTFGRSCVKGLAMCAEALLPTSRRA